jgi:transcriptional regulator with XRE-family HTH domain
MAFHVRLKVLREAAGLTQEGLARAADLSASGVAKMERAGSDPVWSTVVRLAAALNVGVDAFAVNADGVQVVTVKAGEPAPAGKPAKGRGKK